MNTRLNTWVKRNSKISQFQAGFQKGRSSLDHVFVLNSIIQTQLLKSKPLYCCFIDLSQAFDSPNHYKLWNVLLSLGVSPKWVRVFSFLYEMANARIKTKDGLTDPINIMKGVLQGESASPSIFNLFMEEITNTLDHRRIAGMRLQSIIVHIIMYADDMVTLAPSKETANENRLRS